METPFPVFEKLPQKAAFSSNLANKLGFVLFISWELQSPAPFRSSTAQSTRAPVAEGKGGFMPAAGPRAAEQQGSSPQEGHTSLLSHSNANT